MTKQAWSAGMALLAVNLRDRELTQAEKALRGQAYRRELDHLTDEAWAAVVQDMIRSVDWFPTIRELLDSAARLRSVVLPVERQLEADTRTPDEKRADAKRGLALVRAEVAKVWARPVPALPVRTMEPEPTLVRFSDQRMADLQAQARAIVETQAHKTPA